MRMPVDADAQAMVEAMAAYMQREGLSPEAMAAMMAEAEAATVGAGEGEAAPVPPALAKMMSEISAERAKADGAAAGEDPSVEAVEVVPEPGWVVKTLDVVSGRKVFINVCGSALVDAPGEEWRPEDLPDPEGGEGGGEGGDPDAKQVRFPLSLGDARVERDKKGEPCTVYDIVFNDDVLSVAMQRSPGGRKLKLFLVDLSLQWIAHKKSEQLDPKFKLPNLAYKGPDSGPVPQRMRRKKRALIEEFSSAPVDPKEKPVFALGLDGGTRKKGQGRAHSAGTGAAQGGAAVAFGPSASPGAAASRRADQGPGTVSGPAEFVQVAPEVSTRFLGEPAMGVEVSLAAPLIFEGGLENARRSVPDIKVTAEGRTLRICAGARYAPAEVSLPLAAGGYEWGGIAPGVVLDPNDETLRVTVPLVGYAERRSEAARCKPHAVGELQFESQGSILELD